MSGDISGGLFQTCVYFYKLRERGLLDESYSPWLDQISATLKKILTTKARALAAQNPTLRHSPDHPGYVYLTADNIRVYIPWLIVEDLPSPDILSYLIGIASQIKSCTLSSICLSGSTLYFGSLRSISDIDFLEYDQGSTGSPAAIKRPDGFGVIVEVGDYVEYVVDTPFFGVVAASNKIASINNSTDGPSTSSDSSPFQEAPVNPGFRILYDPMALGEYIQYLSSQSISWMHNSPTKAAKRLLPLARLIGDRKLAYSIISAFDSAPVQQALHAKQKIDLIRRLRKSQDSLEDFSELALKQLGLIRSEQPPSPDLSDDERNLLESLDEGLRHIGTVNLGKIADLAHD